MNIHFLRHFQSEVNPCEGFDNLSLEDRRRIQMEATLLPNDLNLRLARSIGLFVRTILPEETRVFTSEHQRAVDTLAMVLDDVEFEIDPLLNERDFGQYSLLSKPTIISRDPNYREERRSDPIGWKPPDGESYLDVKTRLGEFIQANYDPGTSVFCVTHETVIYAAMDLLSGIGTYGIIEKARKGSMPLGFYYSAKVEQ